MNGYTCGKQITLSGKTFFPGDAIPPEYVLKTRELALVRSGCIVKATGTPDEKPEKAKKETQATATSGETKISIPIIDGGKKMDATISPASVYRAFEILQITEKSAVKACKTEKDDDALMLVNAVDQRKAVIAAANARHEALVQEAGEAGGSDGKNV